MSHCHHSPSIQIKQRVKTATTHASCGVQSHARQMRNKNATTREKTLNLKKKKKINAKNAITTLQNRERQEKAWDPHGLVFEYSLDLNK